MNPRIWLAVNHFEPSHYRIAHPRTFSPDPIGIQTELSPYAELFGDDSTASQHCNGDKPSLPNLNDRDS